MVRASISLVAILSALPAPAESLRIFGSGGYESQLTPANANSPLNPDNFLEIPDTTSLGDLSVFGEASSESRRWKVRMKIRGEASDRGREEVALGEGYLQIEATEWLDITAGRVIEKWGTGYGWTPTAFVGPAKNPTDPNDRRSADRGVDMIRADLFIRETNLSLFALADSAFAARVYRLVGGADVSLYYRRDDDASREGVSLSRTFGDRLELHADLAHSSAGVRAVAGGQSTFGNDLNAVLEIYHQDDGLSTNQWDVFRDSVDNASDAAALLTSNREYAPMRMGRDYGFLRLARPFAAQKGQAELIAISNLRDGSTLGRLALTYELRASLSAYVIETEFFGDTGSELAYIQVERVTSAGVRYYF